MKKIFLVFCVLAFLFIGCSDDNYPSSYIEGLTIHNFPVIDGSTSTYPLNLIIASRLLGINYDWVYSSSSMSWRVEPRKVDLSNIVKSSQTHNSIINLIDKNVDIILSARTLSFDEKNYAESMGVSLLETPIALDALIFIINPNNINVDSLTTQQIQNIYTGRITNWSVLGGSNSSINAYVRNTNSGSQELMESLVMKDLNIIDLPESPEIIFTMGGVFEKVRWDHYGICYTVYYYKEHILRDTTTKTIAINGIEPNKETIRTKSYPLVSPVYVMIRSDLAITSMAYQIYKWLQTEACKNVISESGYVPYF